MNNEISIDNENHFGEIVHSAGEQNPLAVGFGSCCCSSSACVFVGDEQSPDAV